MEEVGPPMLNLKEGKSCPLRGGTHREALDTPRGPKSLPCGGFLIPGSLSVVPFPYIIEFFGWHIPEYKILEKKKTSQEEDFDFVVKFIKKKTYYITDPFFLFIY